MDNKIGFARLLPFLIALLMFSSIGAQVASLGNLSSSGNLTGPIKPPLLLNSTHYTSLGQAVGACAICTLNLTTQTVPFGTLPNVAAGKSVYYSTNANGTNYVTNVLTTPVISPLTEVIDGQTYPVSNATQVIEVADIGGHVGLSNRTSFPINISLSDNPLNPLVVNYEVKNNKNGHILSAGSFTGSSFSKNLNFSMPLNSSFSIDYSTSGNSNYTPVSSDPVVLPVNIYNYMVVNVINDQATAYSPNSVIILGTAANSNTVIGVNYITQSLQNVVTCNLNNQGVANPTTGVLYSSYIVGNTANIIQTNSLCANGYGWPSLASSSNVVTDVYVQNANYLWPAASSNNLLLVYSGNFISGSTNTILNGVLSGEAGYLDGCANDNGANVFESYNSFCGVTSLASIGWSNTLSTTVGGLQSSSTNILISASATGNFNSIFSTQPFVGPYLTMNTPTNTVDIVKTVVGSATGTSSVFGLSTSNTFGGTFKTAQTQFGLSPGSGGSISQLRLVTQGTVSSCTAVYPTLPSIFSFTVNNAISSNELINYNNQCTQVTAGGTKGATSLFVTVTNTIPESLFVIDSRPTPPNNYTATTNFGPVNSVALVTIGAPTNLIVDAGQYQSFVATWSAGQPNYQVTFNAVSSGALNKVQNTLTTTGFSGLTQTWTYYVDPFENANSPIKANVFIYDNAGVFTNSIYSSSYTSNTAPTQPTLAFTNTLIDAGQFVKITPTFSGGSPAYVENIVISSQTSPYPAINTIQVTVASATAELFFVPSWVVGNNIQANVVVTDSATTNSVTNSVYYALGFNGVLAAGNPTASNAFLDNGQYTTVTANPSLGTQPYTYQWYTGAACTSAIGGATSSTYTNNPASTTTYYYKVTDSATTVTTACSSGVTVNVNTALSTPTIVGTNTFTVDTNQYIQFNAFVQHGNTPYTYNFLVYNSATNILVANMLTVTNDFVYQVIGNSYNTIYANVFITDSASTPVTVNSLLTGAWTVNAAVNPQISASNQPTVNPGEYETFTAQFGGTGPWTVNFLVYNSITNTLRPAPNGNLLLVGVTSNSQVFTFQIPSGASSWIGNTIYANVIVTDSAVTPVTANSLLTGIITVSTSMSPSITWTANGMAYGTLFPVTVNTNPNGDVGNVYFTLQGQVQSLVPTFAGTAPFTYILCQGTNFCPTVGYWTVNVFDATSGQDPVYPFTVYVPLYLINTTVVTNTIAYQAYGACSNNYVGGNCIGNIIYSISTTLSSPLIVNGNILVNSGIFLTTNGYPIITSGVFNSLKGNVIGGLENNGGTVANQPGANQFTSFGGSGGAGSGGNNGGGCSSTVGTNGGNTLANGGIGTVNVGGAGSLPTPPPTLSNTYLYSLMATSQNSLVGAGGSGTNTGSCSANGGSGSYGVDIQANQLIMGWVNTIGQAGQSSTGGGGGGGGGLQIYSYGAGGYTAGTYKFGASPGGVGGTEGTGGNGGAGNVMTYPYTSPPIPVFQINTYYPYQFVAPPGNFVSFTANQVYNGVKTNIQQALSTLTFQPPSNQPTGIYEYNFTEQQYSNTISILVNISANMTDISSAFTFNLPVVQDYPNCVQAPTFTTGNLLSYYILSDNPLNQHSNTINQCAGVNSDQWSNANQIFGPSFYMLFNGFTPFVANYLNNPKMTNSITQNALVFVTTNIVPTNGIQRELFNESGYDLQYYYGVNTARVDSWQFLINNYTLLPQISFNTNTLSANGIATWIPISLYQNPKVTVQNLTTQATAGAYQGTTQNNYCGTSLNYGQFINDWSWLPGANAVAYSISVYLSNGQPATNDFLLMQAQTPANTVLSYQMSNPSSFQVYQIPNTAYRFLVYSSNCQNLLYTSPYNRWTSPIALTVGSTATNIPFFYGNITTLQSQSVCSDIPLANNVMDTQCYFANNAMPSNTLDWQLIVQTQAYGTQTCANALIANNGLLNCYSPTTNTIGYIFKLQALLTSGGGWTDIHTGQFGGSTMGNFGLDGALAALLGCIILSLLFVRSNIGISVIVVGIGVELFSLLTLITPLGIGSGGILIITGVGLAIMSRNQGGA